MTKLSDLESKDALYNKIDNVVTLILAIPSEIKYDEECSNAINSAKTAYNNLTSDEKGLVPSDYITALSTAESAYKSLEDAYYAGLVDDLIDEIGNVEYTTSCLGKINSAKEAYNNLTADQKLLVTKLSDLESKDALYNKIDNVVTLILAIPSEIKYDEECSNAINSAKTAYNNLTSDEKALVPAEIIAKLNNKILAYEELFNLEKAKAVDTLIDQISDVVYSESCKSKIDSARKAYNELPTNIKALVTKLKVLETKESEYELLELNATRYYLVDNNSNVRIETTNGIGIPKNISLAVNYGANAKDIINSSLYNSIEKAINNGEILYVFNIKLINDNNELIQPSNIKEGTTLKIFIKAPNGIDINNIKLLHAHNDNDIKYIDDIQIKDNELIFEVDKLSDFVFVKIAGENKIDAAPSWIVPVIIIGIVLFIIIIIVVIYLLLFYKFNVWINKDNKTIRAFIISKKDDKNKLLIMPFRFVYKDKNEIYKSKSEATSYR